MKQKCFSIIKACEYAFDSFVHHPHIFFQLILLIGVPAWIFHTLEKRYFHPAMELAYAHAKERIFELEVAKQLGIKRVTYENIEELKAKWVPLLDRFYSNQTFVKKEVVDPTLERVVATIAQAPEKTFHTAILFPAEESGRAIIIGLIAALISLIIFSFLTIFCIRLVLDFYDFHTINISRAIHTALRLIVTASLGWVVYQAVVLFGLILLIVPGIILALRYGFFQWLLADEKANTVSHSFKLSALCTDGAKWKLFFAAIIACAVEGFSFHVGWLILLSAPLVSLAFVYVYRNLLEQSPEALKDGMHNFA